MALGGWWVPLGHRALNSGSGADKEVAHLDLFEKGKCHGGQEVGLDVEPGGFVERAHHVMATHGVLEIITERRKSSGFKSPLHHCVSLGKSRTSCASCVLICKSGRLTAHHSRTTGLTPQVFFLGDWVEVMPLAEMVNTGSGSKFRDKDKKLDFKHAELKGPGGHLEMFRDMERNSPLRCRDG